VLLEFRRMRSLQRAYLMYFVANGQPPQHKNWGIS
jgi:hypothetical protein